MKLSKGIYGLETSPSKTPFGFLNEQRRLDGIINNAGWYNSKGEKIGTGDLSIKDMDKIKRNIPSDEIFFILTEFNSFWAIPGDLDKSAPGLDYIINNASWIVISKAIIRIREDINATDSVIKEGIEYARTTRKEILKMIKPSKTEDASIKKDKPTYPGWISPTNKPPLKLKTKKLSP